jgi:hypothetical protein
MYTIRGRNKVPTLTCTIINRADTPAGQCTPQRRCLDT